jgi:hypothetical protein
MDTDPNIEIVLAELFYNNENNSSHIYLLKQTLQNSIDDFVEGHNIWEKKKAEIINKMALTLEKLHFLGEYPDPLNTISTYIRNKLAERGVSDHNLDYVGRVLPSKYKNQDLARDSNNKNGMNIHANNNDNDQQIIPTVNIYRLIKNLENKSPTELQNYVLELEQKHKHMRNNMKAEKEAAEYVAIKKQTPLPRYKKVSSEVPPSHLQGWSELYEEMNDFGEEAIEFGKYLKDIAKSIYEFKPENELSKRCAHKVRIFKIGAWKTIKEIFVAPTTDKKWSGDWPKWCDIHLTKLEQSKNYAGSKHALETGEFAVKYKDGTEQYFTLDRGITREQVGDKEPELFEMVKQVLIGNPMVDALHDWSYNTFIDEEYDEDGNPIITTATTRKDKED